LKHCVSVSHHQSVDVAIVGAGPAGLSAALALVRSRKRVALYDCWPPRNAAATEVRGFVTQDGTPPGEMRKIARDQLSAYPTFDARDDDRVTAIRGARGDFEVVSESGSLHARRVVLCLGLVDELPDLPNYRELWGTAVFQCPNCHGWEARDRRFGYLAPNDQCAEWSLLLRAWTTDLVVFTNGAFDPPASLVADFAAARIELEPRPIVGLRAVAGTLAAVQLADGSEVARDVLFVRPPQRQTPLVTSLPVRLDGDLVWVDRTYETSVKGIYAAGDLMSRSHGALVAAAAGTSAAHCLDEELTRDLVLAGAI
jgi:thioredoxin reductase